MVLFEIPDIRLFWSQDPRFHDQFTAAPGAVIKFQSYSKYPDCYKDVSFWINEGQEVHPNDICEIVRGLSEEDLVEKVSEDLEGGLASELF